MISSALSGKTIFRNDVFFSVGFLSKVVMRPEFSLVLMATVECCRTKSIVRLLYYDGDVTLRRCHLGSESLLQDLSPASVFNHFVRRRC